MRCACFVACAVCLAFAPAPARADILYSSFGPGDSFLGTSVQFIGVAEWMTPPRTDVRVANQFSISSPANVSQYRVAISLRTGLPAATEMGYLSLWSGNTEPTTVVENDILFDVAGAHPGLAFIATVDSVLNPLLAPGETYWLLLRAADGSTDSYRWYDAEDPTGLTRLISWTGQDWTAAGTRGNAFEIQGATSVVPEPNAWWLVGTVLLLAGPLLRRPKPRP